jgi:signal transduction histidine kinase
MDRNWFSFTGWCLVCALVIFVFLPAWFIERDGGIIDYPQSSASLVDWRVGFGAEAPPEDEWMINRRDFQAALEGYEGTLWLRTELPKLDWRNPYLFFSLMNRFSVYLDDFPLYEFNQESNHKFINPNKTIHPVRISPEDEGKTLLISTDWEGAGWINGELAVIGEPDQLFHELLRVELAFIVYSILSCAAGLIGILLFIRRKEAMYGWFGLFCLSISGAFLFSCRSLQWFLDIQGLYYWQELLTPAVIWAGIGFYGSALGFGRRTVLTASHSFMALYMSLVTVTAVSAADVFRDLIVEVNTILAIAAFVWITVAIFVFRVRSSSQHEGLLATGQRKMRQWLMRGYYTFMLCAVINFILYMTPGLIIRLFGDNAYFYRVIDGMLPNGFFLFIVCMIMVMVSRVRHIHMTAERNAGELLAKNKELEQFHHNLEELVETRTAELEKANRTLSLTLREKAETLSELSVLEERNRIAYEMHDVVGHTLTAAIVQMEATKRLAERDSRLPLEKLDLLSELVRKGLDDLRRTVRLMKTEEEQSLSLEASLLELIQFTEDTMEIRVVSRMELPAGLSLGKMSESVIYHALQEGLTNGIRHGGSKQFWFELRLAGDMMLFRLVSGGEPFGEAVPGFGLSSMMERVELLDGKVTIGSSRSDSGTPEGCELLISLPVR